MLNTIRQLILKPSNSYEAYKLILNHSFSDISVDFYRTENCCNDYFNEFAADIAVYTEVTGSPPSQMITSKVPNPFQI